jgi:hypothetical protein
MKIFVLLTSALDRFICLRTPLALYHQGKRLPYSLETSFCGPLPGPDDMEKRKPLRPVGNQVNIPARGPVVLPTELSKLFTPVTNESNKFLYNQT